MKLKNLFPVLVEKCLFSCNRSTRLFLSVVMIAMFTAPSTALAQSNGQAVATVQSLGQNPVEYTDLEAAFAAAQNNDEIKLLADCALAADDTHTGKLALGDGSKETDVVLDLNGHTISGTADELITITTNARLRILDSGTGGGIVTTGAKGILNVGVLDMGGGSVIGATSGIYSQGAANISGGTVSGGSYALYIEQGVANISGGTFVATGTDGIGIESESAIGFYFLGLPTFDCTVADISLAKDLQIEFAPGSFDVPAKKIRVKVDNEAPYTFTSNYEIVTDADGDQIAPEDVFVSVDYGEGLIGSRYDSNSMHYEAAVAGLTEVIFPAGTSTYFDQRALALYGTNDNLKFYGIKGLSGSTVQLAEFKSKKFGENSTVIVSNTSDAAITAKMVVAFEGPMASSFSNVAATDLDVQEFPPIFLDGTEEALTEIFVPEDYEVFGFSDNSFVLLGSDATAAANSGWLVAEKSKLPEGVSHLSILWPDGTTTGYYLEASWISLADGPFVYDGTAKEPAVTVTDNGTDVTDSFEWTYKNNVAAHDATGNDAPTVTVTAKATSTSYTGSVSKTFTINKKPITVTAENKSMAIGGTEPVLTYTIEGLVEGETVDIELQRTEGNDAGTYDITLKSISGDDNYSVTFVKGTFTIKKEANISIKNPENLAKDGTIEVDLGETEYAPSEKELAYFFTPVSGVTVVAVIKIALEPTSGNKAIYKVTDNYATKLTFGDVEWKESGALLTRPKNLTFSGAAVDVSNIHFTNASTLSTGDKMTLVSGFGNSAGAITGSNFTDASGLTGEGHLYFESGNIDYIVTKGTEEEEEQGQEQGDDISDILPALERDPRPDGEYEELDGSKTTILTDGNTQHITNTKTNENGSKTVTDTYIYEDGSIAVKETVTNTDGSMTVKETVKNADGSIAVKETETNADGSMTVKETVKDADGSMTVKETVTNADGSVKETVTNTDGSMTVKETVKDADGNVKESVSKTLNTYSNTSNIDDPAIGATTFARVSDVENVIRGVIQNTTDENITNPEVLIAQDDVSNVLINTKTVTNAQGQVTESLASITIKQNPTSDGTSDGITKMALNLTNSNLNNDTGDSGAGDENVVGGDDGGDSGDSVGGDDGGDGGDSVGDGGREEVGDSGDSGGDGGDGGDGGREDGDDGDDGENPESQNSTTSGTFGNFTWKVSKSHDSSVFDVLTISGSGKMETGNKSPWSDYNTQIKTVNINEGVTSIGENAFAGYTGDYVNIIVPEGKILSVIFDSGKSPELIRPTSGQVDIIEHLFANPSDRTSSLALMVDDVYPQLKEGDTFTLVSEGAESPLTVSIPYICYHSNSKSGKILYSEAETKAQKNGIGMKVDATVTAELVDGTNDTYKVTENKATKLTLLGIPHNIANGDTYFYRPQNISFEEADIDIQNINLDGVTLEKGDKICLIRDFGKTVGNITGSKSPNYRYIYQYHAYLQGDEPSELIFEIDSKNEEQKPSTQDLNDQAATTMIVQYDTKKVTGDDDTGAIYGGRSKVTTIKITVKEKWGEVHNIIGGGTRAAFAEQEADDEIEIVSGQEYKILRDGFIVLNFYTPDASITVNSIIIRRPGDANNDGYLNAADLVEMVNAKNGHASERFNLTNADIDRDGQITQDDIDAVVKLIMEQTDEK